MKKEKIQKMTLMAILTAIIILMSFTPLGYLKTAGLEITFIVIPVVVGSILCGPGAGAFLGGVFGITSFIQCFGFSPFGAALLSINAFFTFIVCLAPRILCGYLSGLTFSLLNKSGAKRLSYLISSAVGPIMNTVLFMGALVLLFWNTEYIQGISNALGSDNIFMFIVLFVGIQGLVEAASCMVLATAISAASDIALKKYVK